MKKNYFLKNNKGYSLIELITVIAILSVTAGMMTYGASLVFSKDAIKCANAINDAIYDTRAVSMTKSGDYKLKVSKTSEGFVADVVLKDESGTEAAVQTVLLDEKDTIEKIDVVIDSDPTHSYSISETSIYIGFDKSKGNVDSFGTGFEGTKIVDSVSEGATGLLDGVITFTVKQKRGNKPPENVSIVTSTGKHFVGDR